MTITDPVAISCNLQVSKQNRPTHTYRKYHSLNLWEMDHCCLRKVYRTNDLQVLPPW